MRKDVLNRMNRFLWGYALLGAAIAWLAHLLSTYAIGEAGCVLKGSAFEWMNLNATAWALILVSVLCLSLSIGSGAVSIKLTRKVGGQPFVGHFGLLCSVIFTFAIIAQTVPIFTLSTGC